MPCGGERVKLEIRYLVNIPDSSRVKISNAHREPARREPADAGSPNAVEETVQVLESRLQAIETRMRIAWPKWSSRLHRYLIASNQT